MTYTYNENEIVLLSSILGVFLNHFNKNSKESGSGFVHLFQIYLFHFCLATEVLLYNYIPRRKSGIYWIQVRRAAAAAAAVEISLWTR